MGFDGLVRVWGLGLLGRRAMGRSNYYKWDKKTTSTHNRCNPLKSILGGLYVRL